MRATFAFNLIKVYDVFGAYEVALVPTTITNDAFVEITELGQ